jgi:hypothetical protein
MTILSTKERKYQTKTFLKNFAKKVRTSRLPFPVNAKLKLSITTINEQPQESLCKLAYKERT